MNMALWLERAARRQPRSPALLRGVETSSRLWRFRRRHQGAGGRAANAARRRSGRSRWPLHAEFPRISRGDAGGLASRRRRAAGQRETAPPRSEMDPRRRRVPAALHPRRRPGTLRRRRRRNARRGRPGIRGAARPSPPSPSLARAAPTTSHGCSTLRARQAGRRGSCSAMETSRRWPCAISPTSTRLRPTTRCSTPRRSLARSGVLRASRDPRRGGAYRPPLRAASTPAKSSTSRRRMAGSRCSPRPPCCAGWWRKRGGAARARRRPRRRRLRRRADVSRRHPRGDGQPRLPLRADLRAGRNADVHHRLRRPRARRPERAALSPTARLGRQRAERRRTPHRRRQRRDGAAGDFRARSRSAGRRSCWATGGDRRRQRKQSAAVGCAPATSAPSTRTAISRCATARRT